MNKFITIIVLNIMLLPSMNAQEGIQLLGSLNPRSSQGYNDIWGYAADGREYALLCTGGGTSIIDITDPVVPVEVSFIPGPSSGWRDIKTHDTYAYIVTEGTGGDNGLQIVDLSNLPNSATLVKTTTEFFERAHNIFISEGFAYVIGTNNGGGMHILDLADPENPVETAYYLESDYIHDIYAWSDTVVACTGDTYDLVDVTDKTNPTIISSSASLPGTYAHSGWMTEDKRYFIATEEGNNRDITIWDLQNRRNWNLVVDQLVLSSKTPVHNIFVRDNYAHVSYYAEGYVVLDISEPTNPLIVAQYDTSPSTSGFNGAWGCYPFLPSGNIIVSDMQSGLYVFSFTPIENPAPFLSPTLAPTEVLAESETELDLSVMDNGPISEAYIYYRTVVEGNTGAWNVITNSNGDAENNFHFAIPAQPHLSVVEYYFAVADEEGKVSTAPRGGSGDPPGSVPPPSFYGYTTILAGVPIVTSFSPEFADTTITKGESIQFIAEAKDTSSLEINYSWYLNGLKKSSTPDYKYGTTFIFSSRTDTVKLVVDNGYRSVSRSWIITVDFTLDVDEEITISYGLNQNYPNPFNPSTTISYSIPKAGNVNLKIYNALGELITTLVNEYQISGKYEANFNAGNLSSGIYIAKLVTANYSKNIKMLLVK